MDPMGGFPNEEWESFERMFSSNESLAITMQLEGDSPPHFEDLGYEIETPSIFWPPQEPNLTNIIGSFQNDVHFSALIGCNHIPIQNSDNPVPMDYCMAGEKNGVSLAPFSANEMTEVAVCLNGEMGSDECDRKLGEHHSEAIGILGKRKIDDGPLELHQIEVAAKISPTSPQSPNKRPKVTKDVRKSKKSVKNKRNHQKKATTNSSGEEVTNGEESNGQSTSSCCSSEDDSNASENSKGSTSASTAAALNLNGKPRATRGAATDPQSLYARKRRERINERLKILQNLVPNGTKVDISTMLEEAVHYVKFLQLQIKLLSSDDLWMYAPIAYNGMDSGLNQKLSSLFKM